MSWRLAKSSRSLSLTRISTVVHLPVSPTLLGLCWKPRYQSKEHHVPLRWCDSSGSSPTSGTDRRGYSTLLFGGADLWNHERSDHEMAAEVLLLMQGLFLSICGRWEYCLAHDPLHQFGWPAADRFASFGQCRGVRFSHLRNAPFSKFWRLWISDESEEPISVAQ